MKFLALSLVAVTLLSPTANADEAARAKRDAKSLRDMTNRAVAFLQSQGQAEDGSFSKESGIGITALVATAMMKNGVSPDHPSVAKALDFLKQFVQPTGGIHQPETRYRNYETSLAILCFAEANANGSYDELLAKADLFVKGIQWTEEEGAKPADTAFGGSGYGKHGRPDLSNTSFFIEALKATGNDADSEALKRALTFVSRCQNLESEHNTTEFADKIDDGVFYYTPAAGGTSQAGTADNGGLRSYASMTYAGLKSMIYAGVGPDDQRVTAAVDWIKQNYDLSSNPGMGDAGHYYYLHTFAKALNAIGIDELEDEKGRVHKWRSELITELVRRQKKDGSWINKNSRWLEGDPNLVSGYALLAVAYCRK